MAGRYVRQQWQSGLVASPFGPVSGDRLDHMEDGIETITDDFDAHVVASNAHPQYLLKPGTPVVNGPVYWDGAAYVSAKLSASHIAAAAGITKSQLAALGITDGDIASGAAIAYAKLALAGAIKGADIDPANPIPYAKLNLAGSVSPADLGPSIGTWQPGMVGWTAAAAAPTGFIMADGASYLRTTPYDLLFAAIGTQYGAVDGSHFSVPDIAGRTVYSKGTNADVDTLGDNEGSSLANRSPKHRTSMTDPGHTPKRTEGGGGSLTRFQGLPGLSGTFDGSSIVPPGFNAETTGITVGPGGTGPIDMPAYIVLNAIIKL